MARLSGIAVGLVEQWNQAPICSTRQDTLGVFPGHPRDTPEEGWGDSRIGEGAGWGTGGEPRDDQDSERATNRHTAGVPAELHIAQWPRGIVTPREFWFVVSVLIFAYSVASLPFVVPIAIFACTYGRLGLGVWTSSGR